MYRQTNQREFTSASLKRPRKTVFSSPQTHLVSRLGRQLSVASSRVLQILLQELPAFRSVR